MSRSFPLLSAALDGSDTPVTFFFRDDDVGWADAKLFLLCDRFHDRAPLDLAVIPTAIQDDVASALRARSGQLGFHQHGYTHRNHENTGKKCELSDGRPQAQMADELHAGRERLKKLFDAQLDPIFTPPWNRCGATAAQVMVDLGVSVLSRDRGASPLDVPGLVDLPIAIDWSRHQTPGAIDTAIAEATTRSPVGIMLHHEVLDERDLRHLDGLLDTLIDHQNAALVPMRDLHRESTRP